MRALGAAAVVALLVAGCVADRLVAQSSAPAAASAPAAPATPAAHCTGTQPPTYVADVRPVLERRCFTCHANDGPAAEEHDFTHIETLRAQRLQLVDEVTARAMPPKGRPQLTDGEAQTLLQWVACGANER
jgi:uncharacterized membrane protein